MAWKVELDPAAVRELRKIDQKQARRILTFLHERVAPLDDPRSIGQALKGSRLGNTASGIIASSAASRTTPYASSLFASATGATCTDE